MLLKSLLEGQRIGEGLLEERRLGKGLLNNPLNE